MNKRGKWIFNIFAVLSILVGCSVWRQLPNTVLIREPNSSGYAAEVPASTTASEHAPYAVLSARIYDRDPYVQDSEKDAARASSGCGQDIFSQALAGWQRWPDFPPQELSAILNESNMHVEVWQNLLLENPQIVVVFEGTVFTSLNHWKANLRWFQRFLPGYQDHYTIAAEQVAEAFLESLQASSEYQIGNDSMLRLQDGRALKLIATGHSLGGGLAQQFAYALPQNPNNPAGPRVHEVFAFDPSPVTGWFATSDPPRSYNAAGLRINRIFEHGEILAYLRIITSNIILSAKDPEIWLYRYNVERNANIVDGHSMPSLACGILKSAMPQ